MKKITTILLFMVGLSGCDVIRNLKYEYYLGHRGKLVCQVTAAADETLPIDSMIQIENVNGNYPEVSMKDKITKYRKIVQEGNVLNIQRLEPDTGISHIIIVQTARGELLYNVVGIDNENLVSRTYRAQCK